MALHCWLANFALDLAAVARLAAAGDAVAGELQRLRAAGLAVELLLQRDAQAPDAGAAALLLSAADTVQAPSALTPLFAFCNDQALADHGRCVGLPMVEAELVVDGTADRLQLAAARFPAPPPGADALAPVHLAVGPLLSLGGLAAAGVAVGGAGQPGPAYHLAPCAPDPVELTGDLLTLPLVWAPQRQRVQALAPGALQIDFAPGLRFPDLAPLLASNAAVWALRAEIDAWPALASVRRPAVVTRPRPLARAGVFGAPDFRFDEVEVIGFRFELPGAEDEDADDGDGRSSLQPLIESLNFHLAEARKTPAVAADFEYRVATPVVIIELLRYGRMRSLQPLPPLRPEDAMPQHELLVRLLVGKIDDDTAQARDAAGFVPSIFVDNPWSKSVGRQMLGYPKMLATFSAGPGRALAMDGRPVAARAGDPAVPLTEVRTVSLLRRVGRAADEADTLLELDYAALEFDDHFDPFDLALLGGRQRGPGWQPGDFGAREFRRSFARGVAGGGYTRLDAVQVTPQDALGLPPAWVGASTGLHGLEVQFPRGIASLRLHPRALPDDHAWAALCRLLGAEAGAPASLALPTGDWYRLRCAMDYRASEA